MKQMKLFPPDSVAPQAPSSVKISAAIVPLQRRCKCWLGCGWRDSRGRQRERRRPKQRGRWVSRLGSYLAPVCGSRGLMCHPDPEGADSIAGLTGLLMLLRIVLYVGLMIWKLVYFARKDKGRVRKCCNIFLFCSTR